MPTLTQIIQRTALRMDDVAVNVNSSMSTVCIVDLTYRNDSIFLQGDEADKFIAEVDQLWDTTGDTDKVECGLHVAAQYVETLWN